jgi:hypothetical protein
MQDARELAAFLAHIGQETNGNSATEFNSDFTIKIAGALGNGYGLHAITEGTCATEGCPDYGTKRKYCTEAYPENCENEPGAASSSFCQLAKEYCLTPFPADDALPSSQFFGRGGKQLSYAFNYMYYGSKIYPDDPFRLGNNPTLLDTDGVLGWETALAYWALPFEDIHSTKPSMSEGFFKPTTGPSSDLNNEVGFGKTVNLINGGVECGRSLRFMKVQTLNRINNYVELLLLNYGLMPIDRLEVTRQTPNGEQADVYTKAQLIHNISTLGIQIRGADFAVTERSTSAPHLVKQYTTGGQEMTANYAGVPPQPKWWGAYGQWDDTFYYGRYNSQPLIQEYYARYNGEYLTNIIRVMLYYNLSDPNNTQRISQERLDCTGVTNFAGK